MKLFKALLILIVLCITLISCEKYLDVKRTNTQTPIKNANDLQLLLDNTTLNLGISNDGDLSSDDFFVDNNTFQSEYATNEDRDLYTWNSSAARTSASAWQHTYFIVYNANLVLEYGDKFRKNGTGDQQVLNIQKGMALFYRAWGHWQIAQLYCKPYNSSTSNQDPGIPIKMSSDINERIERGTVQTTYNQILADLKEAVGLLPNSAIVPTRPSKAAAYALLARVYLSMEDYSNAFQNANSSLQIYSQLIDFNTISRSLSNPFTKYNKEVLFHSVGIYNFFLEPISELGEPVAKIDPILVSSYMQNDLRKELFIKENTALGAEHVGTYRFSGNYDGRGTSVLFNGLAVDEIYLIRAECYVRLGNITSALADLNTLLRTRWVSGTYVDLNITNADDLLTRILAERRKELLMRGLRWSDLRRLNKDPRFAKTLSKTIQGVTYTLPPNDNRFVLLIPTDVIQNKNISQNIR